MQHILCFLKDKFGDSLQYPGVGMMNSGRTFFVGPLTQVLAYFVNVDIKYPQAWC